MTITSARTGLDAETRSRLNPAARALVLQIFGEARAQWSYTSDLVATAFRTNRQLPSGDRRRIAETVYGLVRWDRRLQAILDELCGKARKRIEGVTPGAEEALKLLLYEVRQGVPPGVVRDEARRLVGFDLDFAAAAGEGAGLGGLSGLERDAVRLSYPTWMLERFVEDLGHAEALALGDAMNRRAPMTVRVNTVKISRDGLRERLAEENVVARATVLSPAGLVLETRVNAFGLSAFRDGLFEVMDEGSQLVAEAVAPPPRSHVADACAGAGGKTLALGSLMAGQGKLLALDSQGKKLEELRRRARRAGLSNVAAREVKNQVLPGEARLHAWDRVLVDAPCSGVGTLRRNPEARWRLTPKSIAGLPAQQLGLLVTYAPLVKVGGRLIYATCTVLHEENQRVVERFLAERTDFVIMPLKDIWGKERALGTGGGDFLRVYPHTHDTDGFFAAVLRKVR